MRNIEKIDIYQFSRLNDYLSSYYSVEKNESTGHFNLNSWSKELGYNSPRVVAMVMKAQRSPSQELETSLVKYFNFSGNKKKYFELLSKKAILEFKGESIEEIDKEIQGINPQNLNLAPIDNAHFEYISEWQNLVIKQLIKVKGFRNDIQWIARKLKNKISPSKVKRSLDLLLELGHIKRKDNFFAPGDSIKVGNNLPSVAIKRHHEQMLERAKESLYQDDLDERFIYSITMNFDREDMKEAQSMIQDFLHEFDARFSPNKNKAEDVYQMGIQLFPHTKKERVLH